jgi:hypothetical protein
MLTSYNTNRPYITADEGYASVPIGFSFPFYGSVYTDLSIGVNGGLLLGADERVRALPALNYTNSLMSDHLVAPYWSDLVLDGNASIKYQLISNRFVVTWQNMMQYGQSTNLDQTFQAILDPNGDITFQYQELNGSKRWPTTLIGVRDTDNRTSRGDIRISADYTTNTVIDGFGKTLYVETNYVETVSNRVASFVPKTLQVIRYSPGSGTVDPNGGTATITIVGDARTLGTGGANDVTNNATLNILHNGATNALAVTFIATNSSDTAYARSVSLDSDGDGLDDDDERIAGTDPQDSGSVFTPKVSRGALGPVLSWPYADGRTYTVLYTTSLMESFQTLVSGLQTGTYTHETNEPVIYYRVVVE